MEFSDYLAIQNLVNRYPYLMDAGDFEAIGQLFAEAEIYSNGTLMAAPRDPAALAQAYLTWVITYAEGLPRTRHCLSNLIIEADGPDRAIARCYFMVFQQTDALPLQPIIGGDYRDRLEKRDGTWRFVERRIGTDQFGDLTAHGRYIEILTTTRANADLVARR